MINIAKFKKTEDKETDLILLHSNCSNCGAPLKYNKITMSCKCDYCETEYYVAEDGTLKGQLIELKINGEYKQFYIGECTVNVLYNNAYRDYKGRLVTNKIATKMKLELIEI